MIDEIANAVDRLEKVQLKLRRSVVYVQVQETSDVIALMQRFALPLLLLKRFAHAAMDGERRTETGSQLSQVLDYANQIDDLVAEQTIRASRAQPTESASSMVDEIVTEVESCTDDVVTSALSMLQKFKDAESVWNGEKRTLLDQLAAMTLKMERLCEHRLHHEHVRERVWSTTGGKCFYCDVDLVRTSMEDPKRAFEIDHIVPKSLGGPDHFANFVPACAKCNGEKSDKPFIEFMATRTTRVSPVLRVVGRDDKA